MIIFDCRNVREALPRGLDLLLRCGDREESRAGPVLVMPFPVVTLYERSDERVLLSSVRDANPFFHVMEAMWMLAGRDDSGLLSHYVRDFGTRFAEPSGAIHGAYGHRWRHALGFDQLDVVVNKLIDNPGDRQAVIQMWDAAASHLVTQNAMGVGDAEHDIVAGQDDLRGSWRDRPCNTHVYVRVRPQPLRGRRWRDVTVCCRSNDVVMGAYGANAVHFGFLHEYLAARVGAELGTYYQISNNYHAYVRDLEKLASRAGLEKISGLPDALRDLRSPSPRPFIDDHELIDEEIAQCLLCVDEINSSSDPVTVVTPSFGNRFLEDVLRMALAHRQHKLGMRDLALSTAEDVEAADWREACVEWLSRRAR